MATVRPPKRKRGHRLPPMVEGSDLALDSAIYIQSKGGERVLVPVRPEVPAEPSENMEADPGADPEPDLIQDILEPVDTDNNYVHFGTRPTRNQQFYMKEFVGRVGGILQAMQARETLSDFTVCAECSESIGHWKCEDCIGGRLLCRFCMRHSHFSNPFHRIQCWTGTHFRQAALWEVGVYLTLPHQKGGLCANLVWQKKMLERFQLNKDKDITYRPKDLSGPANSDSADPDPDPDNYARHDNVAMQYLDQMLAGHNPDEMMEDDDEGDRVDTEADVQDMDAGTAGFTSYMNERLGLGPDQYQDSTRNAPNSDALDNQYIRVVHTNGIHHIALVFCTCQGHDLTTDLIYAGWVPTSFIRVRTIFTTAVLDQFRCCNLEMRSSAYQFFQLLRRLTNNIIPSKVVNLYHELRRLSRLWRWVKKLRWAGYAQRAGQPITPKPGELGNFCPACPQVGVNLPENWKDDPNRWVFRRVFTGDGNFVAYHIRSSAADDDIWLSDGLGMTTTNSDYNKFLESAWERATVSVNMSTVAGSSFY